MTPLFGVMTRSDIIAVNGIEKEITLLLQKKSFNWQREVQLRIDQLERMYVPKGYQKERLAQLKEEYFDIINPPVLSVQATQQQVPIIVAKPQTIPEAQKKQELFIPIAEQPKAPLPELRSKKPLASQETEEKFVEQELVISEPEVVAKPIQPKGIAESLGKKEIAESFEQKEKKPLEELQPKKKIVQEDEEEKFVEPVEFKNEPEEKIDKQHIIVQQLDALLALPKEKKDTLWERDAQELIFDLSAYDRPKAHDYITQIYKREECIPCITVQAPTALPKPGGPPPPPMPGILPKPGGPPPPPMPGGPSAPPVAGGPKPPLMPGKITPKTPAITPSSLRKMSNQELLDLFAKHLGELEKNWNDRAEKRIEVPTKYGKKIEIVRGDPELGWNNIMNSIKRVIVERNIEQFSESKIIKQIEDRIAAVRAEKTKRPAQLAVKEEKRVEEITQADVERQIKMLLADPKTTEMSWLVGIKSAIKKMDSFDHAAALKYQEEYIELMPKERRFIKP